DSWEKGPYYVRGLVALAYTLDDAGLKEKAQKWIDWSLESQRENGYFGPAGNNDWWARMPMLMAIRDYYEATEREGRADRRVLPFFEKYFRYQLAELPGRPLDNAWGAARGGDNMEVLYWFYNKTYDAANPEQSDWMLDLAILLANQCKLGGKSITDAFTDTTVRQHVVNTTQALKQPVVYYQQTKDLKDKNAFANALLNMSIDHGRIDGMPNADEGARDNKPTRGTELCSIVEAMLSTEIAARILGEASYGDHLETLAYNSLPAAYAPDYLGNAYYVPQNQVMATAGRHEFEQDHGDASAFGAPSGFECCFPNNHMGWPKFVQSMWMATPDNGLAVLAYGPNTVTAKVAGDKTAVFNQDTTYPFDEAIVITYDGENASFPVRLRIPAWCENPVITVNGQAQTGLAGGSYATVSRDWTKGDTIAIQFPMTVKTDTEYHNALSVRRGPLLYSLKIEQEWREYADDVNDMRGINTAPKGGLKNREVYPLSDWNYGLIVDTENPAASFTVVENNETLAQQPFDVDTAPVILRAKGQIIPEWTLDGNIPATLGYGATAYDETLAEEIELIPFGCGRLRISQFPRIGECDTAAVVFDDIRTFQQDGQTIQEIANVILPEAAEYNMTVFYTGRGSVQLRLNNRDQGAKSFTGAGEISIDGLRAMISDNAFQFTGEHKNNIRFISDDVTVERVVITPVDPVDAIIVDSVTGTAGAFTLRTNLTREIAPYTVEYGRASGEYTHTASGFHGNEAVVTGLESGTYYLKVKASVGGEQLESAEQTVTVTAVTPPSLEEGIGPDKEILDDFSDPAYSESIWQKYGATDKENVTGGQFVFGDDGRTKAAIKGGETWQDYAVEADITVTAQKGDNSNAGIIFRASNISDGPDSYNGYYIGVKNGQALVGHANGGWNSIQSIPIAAKDSHHVKVLVCGSAMQFYVDGDMIYSMNNSLYTAGTVGLRSYEQPFTADNFTVRALNDDDKALLQSNSAKSFAVTGARADGIMQLSYVNQGAGSYKIEYGTQPGVYTHAVYDLHPNGMKADKAAVSGLDNDQTYYVRMTALNGTSPFAVSEEITLEPVQYAAQAPSGLSAVSASAAGAADGRITGVTAGMEYRAEDDAAYTPCTGTEIIGLSAGVYYVRVAKTDTLLASKPVKLIIEEGQRTVVVPGDMDGNGEVTIQDVMEACKVLARQSAGKAPTEDEMLRGSLDGDDKFTITDVMEICKILARKA
ncbi:MAG: hypothetical protein HFE86_02935, partial [Clostridiales bacterium]|nr:hypothetical protein [Clostridiales bacterium]